MGSSQLCGRWRPTLSACRRCTATAAGSTTPSTSLRHWDFTSSAPSMSHTPNRTLATRLLSTWPVADRGERPLPDAAGREGHRRALWGRLSAPFGELPVICTHLAYRFDESEVRQTQVRALAELAAGLRADPSETPPVVLCGDLNAVPDSDEIRLLTGRSAPTVPGLVFNDCWPQVRNDPGHTWGPAKRPSRRQRLARASTRLRPRLMAPAGASRQSGSGFSDRRRAHQRGVAE